MVLRSLRVVRPSPALVRFVWLLGLTAWPALALAQPPIVEGTVLDPDGRPAPGAQVLVSRASTVVTTVTTDDEGRFAVAPLAGGRYRLRVALPGFQSDTVDVDLRAGASREVTLVLRLSAYAESVVVSASRVERPRSDTPEPVAVVTADDLRIEQVETAADALRFVPGLTVTGSGGPGALTSLYPRGGESDFTLVLIDGVKVNDFGGLFDFAHLPVADIERIEVVRSPQSAVWGSDAIGGVVQIVTRRGGAPRSRGVLEGGGFGTTRVGVSTAGSTSAWSWGAGFERFGSDGFTGGTAATGQQVVNDDYTRLDGSGSLGWHGTRTTAVGHVRVGRNERGFPGPYGSDPGNTYGGVDAISRGQNRTVVADLDLTQRWSARVRQQFTVSTFDLDSQFESPFGPSAADTRRTSFRTQVDTVLDPRLDLSAGLELQRESARSSFITDAAGTLLPVDRAVAGYFGEARLSLGRLLVTTGLRIEQVRRDALPAVPSPFAPRPALDERTEIAANPKVAVVYSLRPRDGEGLRWTRLHASVGTGIRPPSAFEIAFTDNPDLRSERSRSVDIGVEQALLGASLVVDGTAFFNRYDDLIVSVGPAFADLSRFSTDNIANSRARGIELGSTWRRGPFETRVSYVLLDTEVLAVDASDDAPPPFEVGDPLLRRPRHQGTIAVRLALDRVTAFGRVGARGGTLDVDPSFGASGGLFEAPGFAVLDLGATVEIAPGIELTGRVDNVLDRRYEEVLGFPALGRRAMGGLRVAVR